MARHNTLRNIIFELCKRALLNPKLEAGAGLGHERRLTRPANILIPSWSTSDKPAAIDVSSLLRLNQAFCLKREWLQVQQLDRQRENTQVMIPSAPNEVGSVFHQWWRHLVHGEEQQASFLHN